MGCIQATPAFVDNDGARQAERDPMTSFDPLARRKTIVRAIHPQTKERLRGQLLKRHVPWPLTEEEVVERRQRRELRERAKARQLSRAILTREGTLNSIARSGSFRSMSASQPSADGSARQPQEETSRSHSGSRTPSHSGSRTPSHSGSRTPSHSGSRTPSHSGSRTPSHSGSRTPSHSGSRTPSGASVDDVSVHSGVSDAAEEHVSDNGRLDGGGEEDDYKRLERGRSGSMMSDESKESQGSSDSEASTASEDLRDRTGHLVRWNRYWLKEPGSDCIVSTYELEDPSEVPSLFNPYLSFVQSVGYPGNEFKPFESIEVRDVAGQWHEGQVITQENNYTFVQYGADPSRMTTEWIHKSSVRLRKAPGLAGIKLENEEDWDTLQALDWVRVRHPTSNQYLAAKIVLKEDGKRPFCIVQYQDESLLQRQEQLDKATLDADPEKLEYYNEFQKRWRFNRTFIYASALSAAGLTIHEMSDENGHSLFRAISHQLFGTDDNYLYLRLKTMEHINKHKDYYAKFVDINFEYYIAHKRKGALGEYMSVGDHLDIQAICEIFDAQVEIYSEVSPRPLEAIEFYHELVDLPCIKLSYRGKNHYDSLVHRHTPVPLMYVGDNREKRPLGEQVSVKQQVLKARQAAFAAVTEDNQQNTMTMYRPTTVVTMLGAVEFRKGEQRRMINQLMQAVNIDLYIEAPANDEPFKIDKDVPRHWWSETNPNIEIDYPFVPGRHKDYPTMRIEGTRAEVAKAVEFVTRNARVSELRTYTVGSRVVKRLGRVKTALSNQLRNI